MSNTNILLETGTNEVEILEVRIDEEGYAGFYGVNVAKVLEIIIPPERLVRLPSMDTSFVLGIFNYRGKVIPLVDVAGWLGKRRAETQRAAVIITEFNNLTTAFLVSGVERIRRLTWKDIRPLEGYMEGLSSSVTGVLHLENKIIFVLDLEKIIADLQPEAAVRLNAQPSAGDEGVPTSPYRLLHVDDSNVIRTTVRQLLEKERYFTVTSLANGEEAWEYLQNLKKGESEGGPKVTDVLDIILTDIEMPGIDGYHLCKKIKEDDALKSLPVALFSSLISEKLLHKGVAVGADAQFTKPDLSLVFGMRKLLAKRPGRAPEARCA